MRDFEILPVGTRATIEEAQRLLRGEAPDWAVQAARKKLDKWVENNRPVSVKGHFEELAEQPQSQSDCFRG